MRTGGLFQQRRQGPLIDFGWAVNFGMPYVLSLAFEQPFGILQGRSSEKPELNVPGRGVDIRYRPATADPASISPLHGFAQTRLNPVDSAAIAGPEIRSVGL